MSVTVFGSLNMDLVVRTPRLLQSGETLIGSDFYTTPGGKGANQAVAVAKLGISTEIIGRVGTDPFGLELLAELKALGVGTDGVLVDATHSGVAVITVAATGENQIIGVFGANGNVDQIDVERLKAVLPKTKLLLLQLEVPIAAVKQAAQVAHGLGVQVILDPAPVPAEAIAPLYPFIDILVPNEIEAGQLVGFLVNSPETAALAARVLQQQGAKTVIVKLGAQGVFCAAPDETFFVPAFNVEAIDTVAAGDAFAGGLAAALVEGASLQQAVIWGAAAGALATIKKGAQAAMPDRPTFNAFLAANGVMS
ncbi:ribokinase [Phormidium sp. CLA17]|uniref:ribokinase n=1 Tax=Leptolyngbya sp. Cla-17 TaxID=2803751 RepID=UPI001490D226|nr:ribokinase [Leptolyngbya sp. Cla-17]MBM0742767.1 ribokinase [Leptolyngbya sp. Cla-17]